MFLSEEELKLPEECIAEHHRTIFMGDQTPDEYESDAFDPRINRGGAGELLEEHRLYRSVTEHGSSTLTQSIHVPA